MKFIDELTIQVKAGKGGDGCCSFRREKFIPFGGPDGGNGGNGGDIYLRATLRLNTLVDLNYRKEYKADKGRSGSGNLRSGKSGENLIIDVPIGTIVWENDTGEMIGDLIEQDQLLLVAQGGQGGLGNHNFKSSVNRAPRKIIKGSLGEERNLRLELRLLADVGLLGFPNVGKSTFISKVSAAKPKIADYPFTTIQPHLGMVRCDGSSFVIADIPGILEGASVGVGLGIRFLKHLSRNKLLLHMVDLSTCLPDVYLEEDFNDYDDLIVENLISQIKVIETELKTYNDIKLNNIDRWIVINKIDILTMDRLANINIIKELKNTKIYWISAVSGNGVQQLCKDIMVYLGV